MGYRSRSATPGTILCLAATVLLAIVSFNTPLLKSLYFLQANYSTGQYAGTLTLGTLGYCLTTNGATNCVGPTVGYEFNPNQLLGVTVFDIPETITKYLTYTLILHIIALACAAAATIFGLLSHISTLSLLCFPTCSAGLASTVSLIALVFDLVIFYIAKARIDAVPGASASIGISVWLVLAAWLLAGLSGCAYGIGRCCVGARRNQSSGDPRSNYSRQQSDHPDDMRLVALRDEQLRKKEQGLPNFQELERTPLTGYQNEEDKYLHEEPVDERTMPGGLRRDGSVLQGVGMGYGRRTPRTGAAAGAGVAAAAGAAGAYGAAAGGGWAGGQGYGNNQGLGRRMSTQTDAGDFVGVGAGGGGVEPPVPPILEQYEQGYYGSDTGHQNYYQEPYHDPYAQQRPIQQPQQSYQDSYPPQSNGYPSQSNSYNTNLTADPYDQYNSTHTPIPIPTPGPSGYNNRPLSTDTSYNSHSHSLHQPMDQQNRISTGDPYDGYDDGLGAIGMAATSGAGQHERDYTGSTFGHNGNGQNQIHNPIPQHLVSPVNSTLLQSPVSPGPDTRHNIIGDPGPQRGYGFDHDDDEDSGNGGARPPSYGAVAGFSGQSQGQNQGGYRNEKSGYQR